MFNNDEDKGKECLIGGRLWKGFGEEIGVIRMVMRGWEIRKRLMLELLVIEGMGEYV